MTEHPPAKEQATKIISMVLSILNKAGIDAKLSELWQGGDRKYIIILKNITELNVEHKDQQHD